MKTFSPLVWFKAWHVATQQYIGAHALRVVVIVIGATVILLGVVMLITPGPGAATIYAGIAILATEFAWARWLLKKTHQQLDRFIPECWRNRWKSWRRKRDVEPESHL